MPLIQEQIRQHFQQGSLNCKILFSIVFFNTEAFFLERYAIHTLIMHSMQAKI